MGTKVNYSGFIIAGTGFFLTRFTVTLALYEDPVRFFFAGIVPLMLGLGLAAFGVALAVAEIDAAMVRTTAVWCVIGAMAMLVLVILTLLGSTDGGLPDLATAQSQVYLSNFLIGGSVGGTFTGLYAARNRKQRTEIQQQANRLEVLNRLLRHEILNAVAVIKSYITTSENDEVQVRTIIEDQSEAIERSVNEVQYLARNTSTRRLSRDGVNVEDCLRASIATVQDRHPEVEIVLEAEAAEVAVHASDRLEQVFIHLLENAVIHAQDNTPTVEVETVGTEVRIHITDTGPGLPESQRALLETGEIKPFDDPSKGFGLNVVRLLVEDFNGSIRTDSGPDQTTITVVLPRAAADTSGGRPIPAVVTGVRPAMPHLIVTLVASILAGVAFGIASEALGGSIAGIGLFYGPPNPAVGWITHEFHSLVFGFVFAGLVSLAPTRYQNTVRGHVAIGVGWSLVLWVGAAGIIAPIWLQLLGYTASIPNITFNFLVTHLTWGISLGLLTAWGYRYITPWLAYVIQQRKRELSENQFESRV